MDYHDRAHVAEVIELLGLLERKIDAAVRARVGVDIAAERAAPACIMEGDEVVDEGDPVGDLALVVRLSDI